MATLILYASKYGTTKQCAEYVQQTIQGTLTDINTLEGTLGTYDRILIGTPIYAGKFPASIRTFLQTHQLELAAKDTTLFFCGMNEDKFTDVLAKNIPTKLREKIKTVPVGGAYQLEQMGCLTRLGLRLAGIKQSVDNIDYTTLDQLSSN